MGTQAVVAVTAMMDAEMAAIVAVSIGGLSAHETNTS